MTKPMGLAASQARFLALTARKADCEFRSMQLAQDKLSITRQLAEATDDYQNSLNATKLVWDYNGRADNLQNLSYSLLTTPSEFNNYNPYLITDRIGRVVVADKLAEAVKASGISNKGGQKGQYEPLDGEVGTFKDFMKSLYENGVVDENTYKGVLKSTQASYYQYIDAQTGVVNTITKGMLEAKGIKLNKNQIAIVDDVEVATNLSDEQIQNIKDTLGIRNLYSVGEVYSNKIGYGEQQLNKDYVSGNNLVAFANQLARQLDNQSKNLFKYSENGTTKLSALGKVFNTTNDAGATVSITPDKVYFNGNQASEANLSSLNISDLLYKQVTVKGIETGQIENFIDALAGTGTGLYNMLIGDGADTATIQAWNGAIAVTKSRFTHHISNVEDAGKDAGNYNTLCTSNGENGVSLSNILRCLLTQFEININGTNNGYSIADRTSDSAPVTSDNDYLYALNNTGVVTDPYTLKADFYMQMYNNLCINGWTENNKISQNDYLESTLKNGTYFITNIHNDNYFYQNRYEEADSVLVVKDEDAIAQAEAEFESMKTQLEYKEEKIDLEMKNLDAEISSVSTEYDSVKNLVTKNIEKIFAQFQ